MRDLDYYDDNCYGCRWNHSRNENKPCKKCIRYTETKTDVDYHTEVKRESVKPSKEIVEKFLEKMRDDK